MECRALSAVIPGSGAAIMHTAGVYGYRNEIVAGNDCVNKALIILMQ